MNSTLKFDPNLEVTDLRSPTQRTAELVAEIANSLDANIQVTVETGEMSSVVRLRMKLGSLFLENPEPEKLITI